MRRPVITGRLFFGKKFVPGNLRNEALAPSSCAARIHAGIHAEIHAEIHADIHADIPADIHAMTAPLNSRRDFFHEVFLTTRGLGRASTSSNKQKL
jgi:hypothetical protein